MCSFGTLYWFELKKIVQRKLFWITSILCVLCIVFTVIGSLLGSTETRLNGEVLESVSNYELFLLDREYARKLSGRAIDQELLEETINAYKKIPVSMEFYSGLEEYQKYARPYSPIFQIIRSWSGMDADSVRQWAPNEAALYGMRMRSLKENWQGLRLTDTETAYLQNLEEQMGLPFVYQYYDGYYYALSGLLTVGMAMLLFIATCLSGIFSEEHTRRTDQLLLSSVNGKDIVYWAKILAGITAAGVGACLMAILTIGLSLGIYGADGAQAVIQLMRKQYSWPIMMWEAVLIAYVMLIVTAVFVSLLIMIGSEVLKSNVAVLAITAGLIVLGMFANVPAEYRVLGQIWDYMPMTFLSVWNVFDVRMIPVFGYCFASWQFVPVVYLAAGGLLVSAGKNIYKRYQVTGR